MKVRFPHGEAKVFHTRSESITDWTPLALGPEPSAYLTGHIMPESTSEKNRPAGNFHDRLSPRRPHFRKVCGGAPFGVWTGRNSRPGARVGKALILGGLFVRNANSAVKNVFPSALTVRDPL